MYVMMAIGSRQFTGGMMSDNVVYEGLALRRRVAEALGWRIQTAIDWNVSHFWAFLNREDYFWARANDREQAWQFAAERKLAPYDTDLNTLRETTALLPGGVSLVIELFTDGRSSAVIRQSNKQTARVDELYFTRTQHAQMATAAWNAVLRWLAREQEAGNE